MAPWAIGTDTGGSVRIPAAWNGITGLKTTIGRISTFGVLPLSPTLDTPGPITRDVEDAALLLTVLQGGDPRDPHTMPVRDVDPMPDLRDLYYSIEGCERLLNQLDLVRSSAAWEAAAAPAGEFVSGSARYLSMIGASSVALTKL